MSAKREDVLKYLEEANMIEYYGCSFNSRRSIQDWSN